MLKLEVLFHVRTHIFDKDILCVWTGPEGLGSCPFPQRLELLFFLEKFWYYLFYSVGISISAQRTEIEATLIIFFKRAFSFAENLCRSTLYLVSLPSLCLLYADFNLSDKTLWRCPPLSLNGGQSFITLGSGAG